MREQRIELPPHSFWVRTAGEGTPVVLVHGLSGSYRWWDRNLEAVASKHLVHAVDLPGFGRNRRFIGSDLPLSFDEVVALLARWLDTLDTPVHLVGHSMGGQTAIELAARVPTKIRSLTLVASTGVPFAPIARAHLEPLVRPPRALITFGPRLLMDALRAGPGSLGLASARLLVRDSRPAMEKIRVPVQLIWGDSDPFVPLRYADAIREKIPQAKLSILRGGGHVPMWDVPEEFNGTLLEFLSEVEREPWEAITPESPAFSWGIRDCRDGVCWRASDHPVRVVMIHGLGIGSRYLRKLAAALHERGIDSAAPDLPGIGESSVERDSWEMDELAKLCIEWAESQEIERAVWVGHSTGALLVDRVMKSGSRSISSAVQVGPIWTRRPLAVMRLMLLLALDAFREPWPLFVEAATAYWKAGLLQIWRHARASAAVLADDPARAHIVVGESDPLVDRRRLEGLGFDVAILPGAHGIVFSNPEGVAEEIARLVIQADSLSEREGHPASVRSEE